MAHYSLDSPIASAYFQKVNKSDWEGKENFPSDLFCQGLNFSQGGKSQISKRNN